MRRIALACASSCALIASPSPTTAHCYSHWAYPRPQPGCGVYARVSTPSSEDKSWFVEIVLAPPLTDDERRAQAIEQLKRQLGGNGL
jgi:hypothetical protein